MKAQVKERPVLMNGEMVRAVLREESPKTQTRRIVVYRGDAPPDDDGFELSDAAPVWLGCDTNGTSIMLKCPYGQPGDRLWIRETFARDVLGCETQGGVSYRADHNDPRGDGPANPMRWTPAIHMPRALSRIDLEVTAVRVERLCDIPDDDVRAEGVTVRDFMLGFSTDKRCKSAAQECFRSLWDEINGDRAPWVSNPWVWVVSFRRVRP